MNSHPRAVSLSKDGVGLDLLSYNRAPGFPQRGNSVSQHAIERIGVQREGVFCSHVICPDGNILDSVYHSVTSEEWSHIKLQLENKLR